LGAATDVVAAEAAVVTVADVFAVRLALGSVGSVDFGVDFESLDALTGAALLVGVDARALLASVLAVGVVVELLLALESDWLELLESELPF
jgi:hypothetical protein